jgi:PAS domain S-box-containing protein
MPQPETDGDRAGNAPALGARASDTVATAPPSAPPPVPFAALVAAALDRSDDAVLLAERNVDNTLRIVAMNGAFSRMSRYAAPDLIGRPFLALANAGGDADTAAKITAAAAAGASLRTELLCDTAAGKAFWFGLHLMPADDMPGAGRHFVILGRDITERITARDQQNATQSLLANVFVSVEAAVAILAADGRCVMTNPCLDRLLGLPPNALIGRLALDQVAPGARDAAAAGLTQQMRDGRPYAADLELLRKDGTPVPVRLTAALIRSRDKQRFRIITLHEAPAAGASMHVQVAGKVKLVGLDEVKLALGDRWAAMAERALQCAEQVIRRHIDPRDTYSPTEDQGFVICFTSLSEDEASFQAAMIAREIRKRLIGQGEDPRASQVSAMATSFAVPAGQQATAASLAGSVEARLHADLTAIQAQARRTLRASLDAMECMPEAIFGRDDTETIGHYACLAPQLEQRMQAALAVLPSDETAGLDIDSVLIGLASAFAARAALEGSARPVLIELGFETFINRERTDHYLNVLGKLDTKLRQRIIVILSQLPTGVGRSRLQDAVQRLRPLCRSVGFEIDDLAMPLVDFVFSGPPILTISAQIRRAERPFPSGSVARLVEPLHALRGRLLVRHVASRDAARQLRRMGVDMVSYRTPGPDT